MEQSVMVFVGDEHKYSIYELVRTCRQADQVTREAESVVYAK